MDFAHDLEVWCKPFFDKLNYNSFKSYKEVQRFLSKLGYKEAKKMKFEVGKQYNTRDGCSIATIIKTDVNSPTFPIVGVLRNIATGFEHTMSYTASGGSVAVSLQEWGDDLTTEYSPFQNIKIGTVVIVSDSIELIEANEGLVRIFAGVSGSGKPLTYQELGGPKLAWNYCIPVNIEKLKEQN